MENIKQNWFKRSLSLLLTMAMLFNMSAVNTFAVDDTSNF